MTECIQAQLRFSFHRNRPIQAQFDGGRITSDAGLLPLREFDQRHELTGRWAATLSDARSPERQRHSLHALFTQRLYQIVAGYEDANDAALLRHDPIFQLLAEAPPGQLLSSQPTLSRWENAFIWRDWVSLNRGLLESFAALCAAQIRQAGEIVLDVDSTEDPTYGQQEFSFYNGHYERSVYHPLLVFERGTGYLLAAHLRRGEVGSSRGVVAVLRRVVRFLRRRFPRVPIRVVGDTGFAIPTLYLFCEQKQLEYTFGFATSAALRPRGERLLQQAERRWLRRGTPQRLYGGFRHRGKRWRQYSRRICVKAERTRKDRCVHFVITNRKGRAEQVFHFYHGRGECENRIEELKNGFAADRLSCHCFLANAFRLLLHAAAYNLVVLFRHGLPEPLQHAQIETLRRQLFKLGALVRHSARRVLVHLASGWPFQSLFQQTVRALSSA
jgi:Transposase DDE domain group 1